MKDASDSFVCLFVLMHKNVFKKKPCKNNLILGGNSFCFMCPQLLEKHFVVLRLSLTPTAVLWLTKEIV